MRVVSFAPSSSTTWTERGARVEPVVLLQIALLLLVVANLGRIPLLDLGDRQAPLLINDLCVGAVLIAGVLTAMRAGTLRLDGVAMIALLFASIGGLSALSAVPRFGLDALQLTTSLAYLVRWSVYFGLYVVVVNFVRPHHIDAVWRMLERAMLVFAAFGVLQSIFLPNFAQTVYPEQADQWDMQGTRLVSTVLEPNVAAAMILTVLLVQVAQLSNNVKVAMWKPALLFVALAMTLSRSGGVAFMVGALVILFAHGLSKRLLRFAASMLVAALAALPKLVEVGTQYSRFSITDESAASRLIAWQRALAVFWEHPWFGIGFNTYGFVQELRGFERTGGSSYSVEGGLLFVAVMTGVAGLAVFMAMLWLVLRRCRAGWRDTRATPANRALCMGVAASTVAVCVHSVFVNSLLVPFVMEPLFVTWGLVYVARSRMRTADAGGT